MDETVENVFSCCEINWNIKNFCFANPPNDYVIFSPEFILQGVKTVKWKMSLELENNESSNDGQVSFYLEKLPISKGTDVFVDWELTLTVGRCVFGPFEKTVEFKDQSKHGQVGIASTAKIFDSLIPIEADTLRIRFYFVTFDRETYFELEEEHDDGLFSLSEDLFNLKLMKSYTDIKIKVNDEYIEAHKAILSLNDRFVSYIENAKNDVIEISNFDYKILDAFVNYLYTENIKHLRMYPSLSMIRCLEHFDCDQNALKAHYFEEAIQLESKIKVETHEFHWHVTDIFDKNEFVITSPPFKGMHTTWTLTLSLKRNDPNKNLSIYAEITDGERPSQFCLEFSLINVSKKELFPKRLLRLDGSCDSLGFDEFVSKKSLTDYKSLTLSGALCIFFRAKTSTGTQENRKGRQSVNLISPASEVNIYSKLSEKTENLLAKRIHCDVTLHVNIRNSIKAHKCILAARSPGLRRRIEEDFNPINNLLFVGDLDPDLLKLTVNYIYSGILSDEMKSKISYLYYLSAPEKLDVPRLHKDSYRYMKSKKMYIY